MTIHEGADLEGLKIELLGRAAQDYIIAYRAKVDDDNEVSRGYIWCLHPKEGSMNASSYSSDFSVPMEH